MRMKGLFYLRALAIGFLCFMAGPAKQPTKYECPYR